MRAGGCRGVRASAFCGVRAGVPPRRGLQRHEGERQRLGFPIRAAEMALRALTGWKHSPSPENSATNPLWSLTVQVIAT